MSDTRVKLLEQNIALAEARMASTANKDELRRRIKAMKEQLKIEKEDR
jgi:predicted site-specific integrase-resolvase